LRRTLPSLPAATPSVTILRPVRGIDPCEALTLGSGFRLDYSDYEMIFCCADAGDPVVGLVNSLIEAHQQVRARLLIGEDQSSPNPKLNNLFKGWRAARHDWIIIADSNVLMPPDYIQRLLQGWRPDTGVLCSPPIGSLAKGFWAELECALLNTYQARWQYAADSIGLGFAQGKSMLWHRSVLEKAGGLRALASEIAEDAAATKVVRGQGLRVRLVDRPFEQPLGLRSAKQVWDRQVRWARLRRATFPVFYAPEVLSGSLLPLLAGSYGAGIVGIEPEAFVIGLALLWFGSEAVLAKAAGWHMTLASPFAWAARDLMLPVLWVNAWLGNGFTWRGNEMHLSAGDNPDLEQGVRAKS
jgi:ceramide glucosyltransferase